MVTRRIKTLTYRLKPRSLHSPKYPSNLPTWQGAAKWDPTVWVHRLLPCPDIRGLVVASFHLCPRSLIFLFGLSFLLGTWIYNLAPLVTTEGVDLWQALWNHKQLHGVEAAVSQWGAGGTISVSKLVLFFLSRQSANGCVCPSHDSPTHATHCPWGPQVPSPARGMWLDPLLYKDASWSSHASGTALRETEAVLGGRASNLRNH